MALKAEVESAGKGLTKYTLPNGPELLVRRTKNAARRIIAENPEERMDNILETIAAASIAEMKLPADYCDEYPEGKTLVFDPKDMKNCFNRFDPLDFLDQQSFFFAWKAENLPDKAMIDAISAEIKKAKEAAKGKA